MDLVHDRGSMDLVHESGPWTWSMKVVHGPSPKRGSMDPWSMFCPHPDLQCLAEWLEDNNLVLNVSKTKCTIYISKA